jgi:hypothetical protein
MEYWGPALDPHLLRRCACSRRHQRQSTQNAERTMRDLLVGFAQLGLVAVLVAAPSALRAGAWLESVPSISVPSRGPESHSP